VPAEPYLDWLAQQPKGSTNAAESPPPIPAFDSKRAMLCPDCGVILRRYKISGDLNFVLDRCGRCNGVWFDAGEWQSISVRGLHTQMHLFFTESWQRQLRQDAMRQSLEKMYRDRFGVADYEEIKRIRSWLAAHPQSASLKAYLTEKDPYQP
jgi:Zn-finger nucleic acid-binding protein